MRAIPAEAIDLGLTLGPLARGRGDPTMRVSRSDVVRASRTPDGPVAVRFLAGATGVEVEA
jgi:hypothetical protein